MKELVRLNAVVLRSVDYGEADRVVALLSRERGKVSVFARGARKSQKRFAGGLEPFTLVTAEVRERANADLWSLDSLSVERGFGAIRADFTSIACASYVVELARELVRDHEPHPDLFDLTVAALEQLNARNANPSLLRAYELGALAAVGLEPSLARCVECGNQVEMADTSPAEGLLFHCGRGGMLCGACGVSHDPQTLTVSMSDFAALRVLQSGGLAAVAELEGAKAPGVSARNALQGFIDFHLGKKLQSRRFMEETRQVLR